MKKSAWILGLILFIALFLRLFRLTELFFFTMDEELIAWRAWGLFNLNRPFLIGGISPLQVHLPPYFYYLASILLLPFKFNPVGWGIFGAIIGTLTVYALYRLTLKLFDQSTAILAALFQAVSFTAVAFDRHFWPMSFNPLLTVLSIWLLTKISKKSLWPYFTLSLVLLLALSADPSNLSLVLALLAYFIIRRRQINIISVFLSVSGLILFFFTPLFLFDIRHGWQNFGGISRLFQTAAQHQFSVNSLRSGLLLLPQTLVRFWYSAQTNLIEIYSYCWPYAKARLQLPWLMVLAALLVIAWFIFHYRRSKQSAIKLINFLLIFYAFGLTLFAGLGFSLFDHYLTGLLPIFALISAVVLKQLPKLMRIILLLFFLIANLWQIVHMVNPYGLKYKQALVGWANGQLSGQPFALDSVSKCHRENGLRYLFEISGNSPAISFMDANFSWLYKSLPSLIVPDRVLLITDKVLNQNLPIVSQTGFGEFHTYILDNSSKQYKLNY